MKNNIQQYRITEGYTQQQLAQESGVPFGTIRNYEQNRREPTASNLYKIAKALGCTMEELINE